MDNKNWLNYWKKCLSDSLKSDIDIDKFKHFEIENFKIESQVVTELKKINNLIDEEESRINKKKRISNKESPNWVSLNHILVVISPIKIKPTTENLVLLKDKKAKFPFWYYVEIDRCGRLYVPEDRFPIFQRKFLEPLADERSEFIFGSVENVDKATALGKEKPETYQEYIKEIKDVFKKVTAKDIDNYSTEGYETINNAILLLPDEDINAAISIIHLYEKILKEKRIPELLKSFITLRNAPPRNSIDVGALINSNSLHLGQMGDEFPISISQRISLYTYLQANDKIFAVNGPPGTGKTTLLQSIVANKVVESAIKGGSPPIILACSTNNQAVTNIIDSFTRLEQKPGKLHGRWLPDIEGYATYLPSNSKSEVELEKFNYKKVNDEGIFKDIENTDYLEKAKTYFSEKCSTYFGKRILNIKDATTKLRKEIIQLQSTLNEATIKWNEYLGIEKMFLNEYLISKSERINYYDGCILNEASFEADIHNLKLTEEKIIHFFNNEPLYRKLFCFLGFNFALKDRASEIKIVLRDSLIEVSDDFIFTKANILAKTDTKIKIASRIIEKIQNWENWKILNSIKGNPPKTKEDYWDSELLKIKHKLAPNCFYDELDVKLRHKAFQLASHYWEGEYLIKLEKDLVDVNFSKKGLDAMKNRWQRHARLMHCFVSTFYMAPKFFMSYKYLKKGEDGKNIFDDPPLFDFIDLLIVDEAGQVSPEVGVATFSLTKQAIVVGDVKQIEPVWSITHKIDFGNLKECGVIKSYDDSIVEMEFDPKGFLSSTGSIMKMAQNACNFKDKDSEEKGVILVEHRRCYDKIINYCNTLAYNGQLIPLKGDPKKDKLFPEMFCIHVEGNSITSNTSRYNINEVNAIVEWLKINKTKIETRHNSKPIEEVIGIITPFVGQKLKLRHALKEGGFDVNTLKLGTVHALQGAERAIIIFSMVYGKGDSKTMFFDRDNKPNMLNVAVSRAKESFIVFANTGIFNKKAITPSGILSNHLTDENGTPII